MRCVALDEPARGCQSDYSMGYRTRYSERRKAMTFAVTQSSLRGGVLHAARPTTRVFVLSLWPVERPANLRNQVMACQRERNDSSRHIPAKRRHKGYTERLVTQTGLRCQMRPGTERQGGGGGGGGCPSELATPLIDSTIVPITAMPSA